MADNGNGNNAAWKLVGVIVGIFVAQLTIVGYWTGDIGDNMGEMLKLIHNNKVSITKFVGHQENLEWRVKEVEEQICEIDRAGG